MLSRVYRRSRLSIPFIRTRAFTMADNEQSIKRVKLEQSDNTKKIVTTQITTKKTDEKKLDNKPVEGGNAIQNEMRKILKEKTPIWKPVVWIDCEMTGLNVLEDHIIEICCIITDGNFNIIDPEGFEATVYYPKETLDTMNQWCVNQHGKSGLTAKILDNPSSTLQIVETNLLEYIKKYVEPNKAVLAGNSVYMDKIFMMREFPKVVDYLHYRLIDVSSIMEVGHRHNPELMKVFPRKKGNHTAKSDILESIGQLKWYIKHYLKNEEETRGLIDSLKPAVEAEANTEP
ncbi:Piso0_004872 [Millerozyma farinosa CBS 7064]|uniref:Piso0_004872 protein n=1 Tax=Pichia sorbitophila (strain ATCC MYA-4447 / BCRC 22081 / CBS 7064 / NBRC 10061 / NRRL Y-12695) TaxID=559304 RepID=G8Y3L9_PICSO|nr:Piso0_004872 [Millerozyma farinosa CBS 7064]